MKIKKIKIENNPILGNIELDFTKQDGSVYDTILLVGENGSGKSTLLDIIHEFSKFEIIGIGNDNEKRTFNIEVSDDEKTILQSILEKQYKVNYIVSSKDFIIIFDLSISKSDWGQVSLENSSWSQKNILLFNQAEGKSIVKSIFSTVSINFDPKNISNVTNLDTDNVVITSLKSSENLSTEISQMLVDIRTKDNEDESSFRDANGIPIDESERQKRTKRFKKAFQEIFQSSDLEYFGVRDLKPLFKKRGDEILIDKLSSGEKQIVFRGSYLLKDKESIKGCLALIDEPEISLHPIWQQKILKYYQNLFTDSSGVQTSQMFISTHSPYVLQGLKSNNGVIFIFPNGDRVDSLKTYLGDGPSLGVVNYAAFNLATVEFHDELYGYIQTKAISIDTSNCYEDDFEDYLVSLGIQKTKKWTREKDGKVHTNSKYINYDVTLQTFIRNKVHHPENVTMQSIPYLEELKQSIDEMIKLINDNSL